MMDLFDTPGNELPSSDAPRPLADRLRPQFLADVIGQRQILGPEAPLTVMLAANALGDHLLGAARCGQNHHRPSIG